MSSLNALLAIGFLLGLLFSGFQVVPRLGMVRASQLGAVMASLALLSMLLAAPDQAQALLRISVAGFGVSLGLCIHACLNLMFNFVEPGLTALLLGVWGACYAYSRGLATVSGGGLLTLFKTVNGGDGLMAYSGVFGLQIICFLAAALLMSRLDPEGFRKQIKTRFGAVMKVIGD